MDRKEEGNNDKKILLFLGASIVTESQYQSTVISSFNRQCDNNPCETKDSKDVSSKTVAEQESCPIDITENPDRSFVVTSQTEISSQSSICPTPPPVDILGFKTHETDLERKIRTGEATPFGSGIGDSNNSQSVPRIQESFDFDRYLQQQCELKEKYKQKMKKSTKPGVEVPSCSAALVAENSRKRKLMGDQQRSWRKVRKLSNSSESSTELQHNSQSLKNRDSGEKHSFGQHSDPLKKNVLFPKKKTKKQPLGTSTSSNPKDGSQKIGELMSEKMSMYLSREEDSDVDYVPDQDTDGEDDEYENRRIPALRRKAKKVAAKNLAEDDDDSDCSDFDDTIKSKKSRLKDADDGDYEYYLTRVQQWKDEETRFTGQLHQEGEFKIHGHIWEALFQYQKVGVKWLWELHQQKCGGILADEMGLGKTIQVIAFLSGLRTTNLLGRLSNWRGLGPSILVCPVTVLHQWVKEFHLWFPPLRVAVLHDSGSYYGTKEGLIQSINETNGILITSYAGIVSNQTAILKHQWHYVILDEGHKIRNPDAQATLTVKQIATPHRLILSGSPLQNNLKELWSLFDFIYPGKLGTLPAFMEHFSVPITIGGYANANQVEVAVAYKCAAALRDLINPYLLRRTKGDVQRHVKLPEKNEQVLFCKLLPAQRELYKEYLKSKEVNSAIKGDMNAFVPMINLRKICNHPHLFDGGPKIIVSNNNNNRNNCEDREPGEISDSDPDEEFGHWKLSGKMVVLQTLLKLWKQQGHKVLLFTQGRQMLCILENFVKKEGYNYITLDGSTSISSRQPLIKKFNEDEDIFVFVLTTRVGGLGVNLTAANRVILFDPDWNPSTDIQARERAWRIGQQRQVTIYRLIMSGTIEEKMYHRQIFKQFLTNRILKDPKQKRFFKSTDLLELFSFTEASSGGTESEALFAGTGSSINPRKLPAAKKAREKSSGKFRDVPNLVKQTSYRDLKEPNDGELNEEPEAQDAYVLKKLFRKSGVEAAFAHDKIVDSTESDHMIVENEAERAAKDAVAVLVRSREQCWTADSGNANWTGTQGSIKKPPKKLKFGNKASVTESKSKQKNVVEKESDHMFFQGPTKESGTKGPEDSNAVLNYIRSRTRGGEAPAVSSNSEHMELLFEIRQFIAFGAMVDGQATTNELVAQFGAKLPHKDTPLFKKMLFELCTYRKVEGHGVWRLKPEFR